MDQNKDSDQHDLRESLAAELTLAAYGVVLRRERPASWLDLELDLWKVLSETVDVSERNRSIAVHPSQGSHVGTPQSYIAPF